MKLERLKALIDLVADADISELEVVEGDERLRIVKAAKPDSRQRETLPTDRLIEQPNTLASSSADSVVVRAPMFGIFHRAPMPDAPPFAEIGTLIEPGQGLCIIEAMKSFNVIESEHGGRIVMIHVEDGKEVESGSALFTIESPRV